MKRNLELLIVLMFAITLIACGSDDTESVSGDGDYESQLETLASCDDVDCSGHGTCRALSGTCRCDEGYEGTNCDTCSEGYEGYPDCISIETTDDDEDGNVDGDLDEDAEADPEPQATCEEDTCKGHGTCNETAGYAQCYCDEGFIGDYCDSCESVFMAYPDCNETIEATPLVWIDIPGGTFMMGCSTGDQTCNADENPQHEVTVSAFQITATEITNTHYKDIYPEHFLSLPNYPVGDKTWHEAKAYCEAIGGRLPTEAEWEYAARGGTQTIYTCGNNESCVEDYAWYDLFQKFDVATKEPNGYNLYDMAGNVFEWVEDCYHDSYNSAPNIGGVWDDSQCDIKRILRGGCWKDVADAMRPSFRSKLEPDKSADHIGFRCAKDL